MNIMDLYGCSNWNYGNARLVGNDWKLAMASDLSMSSGSSSKTNSLWSLGVVTILRCVLSITKSQSEKVSPLHDLPGRQSIWALLSEA